MGFFDRLFTTDPRQVLERAENLLSQGQAKEALRLAERALKGGSLAQGRRAESLIHRAKEALTGAALEKADLSEASGFLEDAAEWTRGALDYVTDEGRRGELEQRVAQLLEGAEQERRVAERIDFSHLGDAGDEPDGPDDDVLPEPDLDSHYEALVNTLDDDVAERYDDRPEAFRRAFVWLNEGPDQARRARDLLEALVEAHPGDPVYQLERGRCRLLTADHEGACQDLEAVWQTFGDEPLDHGSTLSVPGMWAEAMWGAGRPEALLERLGEVAVPRESDSNLCYHYALALMATKRLDEARQYLLDAMSYFSQPDFPHQLAAVLHAQGRRKEAIDTLERSIAPSCTPASCNRVPKHVPSLRSLAGLYLDQGGRLDRVEQLFAYIAQAQEGRMQAEDYLLLAQYHQQRGDTEAAQEAAAQAKQNSATASVGT